MSNIVKQIEAFVQFAAERLQHHLSELNTRYWNKAVDEEIRRTAYHEHRNSLEHEMEEKIRLLLDDESNTWLKADLENSKQSYLDKLLPGEQQELGR